MSSSFNIKYGTIGTLNRVKKKKSVEKKRNTIGKPNEFLSKEY